ncbi:MAG: transposase [Bacillota bacterium]|jgi:putative transposase
MRVGGVKYSHEQKQEAVISLCIRAGSAKEVAEEHGVTRQALYSWKNVLLSKEDK